MNDKMKDFRECSDRIIFCMDEATEKEVKMLIKDFDCERHDSKIFINYCINKFKAFNKQGA